MEQDALMDLMSTESLMDMYAKTVYLLRESRKKVLRLYAVDNESELLEQIKSGQVSEHPAYEYYLSALILEQTRAQMRGEMMEQFDNASAMPDVCVHLIFKEKLEQHYANRMVEPVRLAQDAMMLSFDTGLMMEIRQVSNDAFSLIWNWDEAELRMDTAPVHMHGATYPSHIHDKDGVVRASPIACAGMDAWHNFSSMLDILLIDPLLERTGIL